MIASRILALTLALFLAFVPVRVRAMAAGTHRTAVTDSFATSRLGALTMEALIRNPGPWFGKAPFEDPHRIALDTSRRAEPTVAVDALLDISKPTLISRLTQENPLVLRETDDGAEEIAKEFHKLDEDAKFWVMLGLIALMLYAMHKEGYL